MTNYAYLRVSTDGQDIENQKLGILEYCNRKELTPIKILEDGVSGQLSWKKREVGKIFCNLKKDDTIIVSEVSRLARSTLQVLEILEEAANKKVNIHVVKNGLVMDGSIQSTIMATVLGLAAQIEREFISMRTKEALQKRKLQGLPIGRPKGIAKKVKLDEHRETILLYLKKKVSKRSIAKIIECSPSTLYSWLNRNKVSLKE